jgi:hypothetical protein
MTGILGQAFGGGFGTTQTQQKSGFGQGMQPYGLRASLPVNGVQGAAYPNPTFNSFGHYQQQARQHPSDGYAVRRKQPH